MTTSPRVRLRPARPDELELFYAIRKDGFESYVVDTYGDWTEDEQRRFAAEDFAALPLEIIEQDGAPIGYQAVIRREAEWFLDEIVLIAAARGRGLGAQLVRAIMDAAHAAGMPLRLSVLAVNPAQRLYTRLGFRIERLEPPRLKMVWP